jgi:hypothetical protein
VAVARVAEAEIDAEWLRRALTSRREITDPYR